ncbi:MAG: hypothetical protein IT359_21275 [Gemmatimonadaceae bacterium]|nr:hypothetical protein [Gemmatimonadaceae bacterium]
MSSQRAFAALPLATLLAVAACWSGRKDHEAASRDAESSVGLAVSSDSGISVDATLGTDKTVRAAGPSFTEASDGSVSMTSTDGAVVMSLRHDSVVVAFSDSVRNSVKAEIDKSMKEDARDKDEGAVADLIKGVVQKSVTVGLGEILNKARGFQVSSLSDVRYKDGAIEFDYVKEPTWTFTDMKLDKRPILESFHPADAARFVGAVRAHLRRS